LASFQRRSMTANQEGRFQISVFRNEARESDSRDGHHQIGGSLELRSRDRSSLAAISA
jgi:hypothetical protein